ncbi:hypothetical protein BRADI_4g17498v3 [Brachypodium distachyon]|uniref:Uncharacterized protein n=1 Tax=Brachypodium distachyon TaxID=15368 RepID=A0A2K2CNI8_BRADI|nr:hypothetical protein BRADI_4g17498v3 [Brachypodium distachyon]
MEFLDAIKSSNFSKIRLELVHLNIKQTASVKLRSQSHGGWKQHRVTIAWGRCATTGQPSRRREGPAPLQGKRATNDVAWRRRRDWAVVVAIVVVKNN